MIMNQFFVFLFVITDKTSNQKKKTPCKLAIKQLLDFSFPICIVLVEDFYQPWMTQATTSYL